MQGCCSTQHIVTGHCTEASGSLAPALTVVCLAPYVWRILPTIINRAPQFAGSDHKYQSSPLPLSGTESKGNAV